MKLVFEYETTDGCTYSCKNTVPFEYSSVVDFQYVVLEKIKEHRQKCIAEYGKKDGNAWYRNGIIKVLGMDMSVSSLEDYIEHNVFTLEEWFDKNKAHE